MKRSKYSRSTRATSARLAASASAICASAERARVAAQLRKPRKQRRIRRAREQHARGAHIPARVPHRPRRCRTNERQSPAQACPHRRESLRVNLNPSLGAFLWFLLVELYLFEFEFYRCGAGTGNSAGTFITAAERLHAIGADRLGSGCHAPPESRRSFRLSRVLVVQARQRQPCPRLRLPRAALRLFRPAPGPALGTHSP